MKFWRKSWTIILVQMSNNPKLDLVNMNAYKKSGEIMSICFQDIVRRRNFGVNQGL